MGFLPINNNNDDNTSILLQCHMHLSTSKINNSPNKLSFQITTWVGDQKLRYDLVWPYVAQAKPQKV